MVSLCAKRLIGINNVLDHMLQKAKQLVVQDHCFFFSYLLTDKKPIVLSVSVYSVTP